MTPLPDNDSRDTYCYEIQVHTGFVRGAGSSAEVSIVLTGALGDSEPRVLKDPKRKILKTGSLSCCCGKYGSQFPLNDFGRIFAWRYKRRSLYPGGLVSDMKNKPGGQNQ